MNIDKIGIKYEQALGLKQDEKYASALKAELTKSKWTEELEAIKERMDSIGSKSDFKTYLGQLESLFNDIYDKITAPGLDAFIAWGSEHAKNQENVDKLRAFLKDNYEAYSASIDDILSAMQNLPQEDERHLFDNIIESFNKKLKSDVSHFVNNPDKFENNIEGFLSTLKIEYSGMSGIEELTYTSVSELYSEEQKEDPNISFYEEIIAMAVSGGQNLSPLDDSEKDLELYRRAKKRIQSIKSCINILMQTGISESDDEGLKNLFKRYDKEMLNSKGDVSSTLSNYISKTWGTLEEKYKTIKEFYETEELQFKTSDWEGFEKEADIAALYNDYTSVRKGNILSSIPTLKLEDVVTSINSCYKKIKDLNAKENDVCNIVRETFEEFILTYNSKKQMLDKLIEKHRNLEPLYNEIYAQGNALTTLTNGIKSIENEGTFLTELSEGTIYDMIEDMKKTKKSFLDILKQSKMEEQINWLNGLSSTTIGESDFNENYLRTLIREGLITLTFKKEF